MPRKKVSGALIISRLPRQFASGEQLGDLITLQLLDGIDLLNLTADALQCLDEKIIAQATTLGWRIMLSVAVQQRFSDWDHQANSSHLFERFGKALAQYGLYLERRELPPVDASMREFKPRVVNELRVVFKQLRDRCAQTKKNPALAELKDWFSQIVNENGLNHLTGNLESWLWFFDKEPNFIRRQLSAPRLAPALIFDAWLACCTGYSQEALRQKISSTCKR